MNRRNFLRGTAATVSVMALAGVLKFAAPKTKLKTSDYLTDPDAWYLQTDLSESSIEDLLIEINDYPGSDHDDHVHALTLSPRHLIVRPDMADTARRVLYAASH